MQVQLIPARNGALRDPNTGRIVAMPGGGKSAITPANSGAYHRARIEKTARHIREGLARASGGVSAYEAIGKGAEELYREVLNPEQDLEKRRKAWLSVGKQAGLMAETAQTLDNGQSSVTLAGGDVSKLLDVISQVIGARQDTR